MFERYVIFYGSKALNKSLSQCPQLEKYVILKTSNKKIFFRILKVRLLYKIVILSNPLPCGTLSSVYKNSFFEHGV